MNKSIFIMVATIATINSLQAMQPENNEAYYLKASIVWKKAYKKPMPVRVYADSKKRAFAHIHDLVLRTSDDYKDIVIQEHRYEDDETEKLINKKKKKITPPQPQQADPSLEHILLSEPHSND